MHCRVLPLLFTLAVGYGRRRRTTPSPPPSPPTAQCPSKNFEECLQSEIDSTVSYYGSYYDNFAMQVAVHQSGKHIGLSSGQCNGRNITIDDTFTFGSGTKPVTAAAVMRLIDAGSIKGDDKASKIIDPYLQKFNGTTLAALFGEAIGNATVLDVIRMSAGIPDFEFGALDYVILEDGGFVDYPYETMHYVAAQKNATCAPGKCVAYSSTSYEAAGLILAAVTSPNAPWYEMDVGSIALPDRSRYPSLKFPPIQSGNGVMGEKISDVMTVPGTVTSSRFGKGKLLFDQNPSVLGWTCGNMVGSARDVANFFYDLFHPTGNHRIVSNASLTEMTSFKTATSGWFAGHLRYGAGLIQRSSSGSEYITSSNPGKWGFDIGHVGDTYGFASTQGYFASLELGYSVASNVDSQSPSRYLGCRLHQIAIEVLGGELVDLSCSGSSESVV